MQYFQATMAHHMMKPKDRLKVCMGALLHPGSTKRWLRYVHGTPALADAASACPKLLTKVFRPYLSTQLGMGARVDTLIDHYETVKILGLEGFFSAAVRAPLSLYEGQTKSGQSFQLSLSAVHDGHREGELCLRLSLQGQSLFGLSFVLSHQDGGLFMKVGRLQGESGEGARELVREATKEFHACRPASLLVTAARQLAEVLGCQALLLVSNRQRIAINLWRRWRISANYDQTWAEMGAVQRPDGFFQLDAQGLQTPDYESIPSKKRSEFKKRVALLDAVYNGLQERLAAERAFT